MRQTHQAHPIFEAIWQKYVLSRISFFIWRLLHGFVATDDKLYSRGFFIVSRCICGQTKESICHLFLDCQKAQPIWRYFHCILGVTHLPYRSPLALLLRWRRRVRSHHHIGFILPCFVLWHIWKARNGSRSDSKTFNINAIIYQVLLDLRLVSVAFGFTTDQVRGMLDLIHEVDIRILPPKVRSTHLVAWLRPPDGVVKLNVDGCCKGNPGISAVCRIFRDQRGGVLAAFGCYLGMFPIIYTELLAIIEGLNYAMQLGFSALEVESDSATVVSWILGSSTGRWEYVYLVDRVRQILMSSPIVLRHVLREANFAADFMANWGFHHRTSRLFGAQEPLPPGLTGIVHWDALQVPHVRR